MYRKLLVAGLAAVVALGFCTTVGAGVAAAKGGDNANGAPSIHGHGGTGGPPGNHGGQGAGAGAQSSDEGTDSTDGNTGSGSGSSSHPRKGSPQRGGPSVGSTGNTGTGSTSHGKKSGTKGVAATGSTTCSFHGKVAFNPPLKAGGTASSAVTVTGLLDKCSNGTKGATRFNNGHLSGLVGTMSTNDCASLSSGAAPALAHGTIMWTPPSKVATSSGVSMPAGSESVVSQGGKSVVQIAYSGGSVSSGSFTNSGSSSLKVTTMQDSGQISSRCTQGLTNVAVSGAAAL